MDNQTVTACEKCKALIFYDQDAPEPKLCPVCQKREKKVIGVWGISNVASLNVWEINDEAVLVGVNDDEPEWCEIKYQDFEDEEDIVSGIDFRNGFWRLDECMRVNN
jgi:hypothetical protein